MIGFLLVVAWLAVAFYAYRLLRNSEAIKELPKQRRIAAYITTLLWPAFVAMAGGVWVGVLVRASIVSSIVKAEEEKASDERPSD